MNTSEIHIYSVKLNAEDLSYICIVYTKSFAIPSNSTRKRPSPCPGRIFTAKVSLNRPIMRQIQYPPVIVGKTGCAACSPSPKWKRQSALKSDRSRGEMGEELLHAPQQHQTAPQYQLFQFPNHHRILSFNLQFQCLLAAIILHSHSFRIQIKRLCFLLINRNYSESTFLQHTRKFSLAFTDH